MLQPMEEMILPPKRQAVVDRLRRRIETYRRRQSECVPRFDQSFSGACEQQNLETSALQKRFLEGKAKRQAKKNERKPELPTISGNLHSSVHVQQKFGCGDYEPPTKIQCGGGSGGNVGEALTKFSVEIVQQLEFTTSAADSQPQQISTNVTVKALANAVKTSSSPPPQQPQRVPTPLDCERECKAECKSEVADDEFVGLDECAAALERDAASAFPGLAALIGENEGDDAFEHLITEISEYPELMKDFDLDGGKLNCGMAEPSEGEPAPRPYSGGEMSPAAQTLKHMAEQHQQAAGGGAGGEWRYRGYPGYRPRAPHPHQHDHLHMSQHQQLHLTQPHHNLQVSAAQHMQVSGGAHVSAAAQQAMYASFQQGTPPPQHHQGGGVDSYSVSQSQNINFSAMRARQQAGAPPQSAGAAPAPAPSLGVVAAGISREQQAKMLQHQQQQMLRAQQQMRPPPPEYKARFTGAAGGAAAGAAGGARRGAAGPRATRYSPEWRHALPPHMQHAAPPLPRHQFPHHHQGFNMGGMGGGLTQQQQLQLQQARLQQQQMMQQHQQQQRSNQQQSPMTHLLMQQNQMLNVQGQMQNIHMSQSQSMSMQQAGLGGMSGHQGHQGSPMQNGPMQGQPGPMHSRSSPMQNSMMSQNGPMQNQNSPMQSQGASMQNHSGPLGNQSGGGGGGGDSFAGGEFNLDFLDNMPSTDASNLTQELLNSLDNNFLNDIL